MTNPEIKPRRDLREPAFRVYEPYISRACYQTLTIDPKAALNFSATTFIARFRDAILAKKRYNYPSALIPDDFNLSNLELSELEGGLVLIKNKTGNPALATEKKELTEKDVVTIMTQIAAKQLFNHELKCSGGEELGKVLAWASKHDEIDCVTIAQNGHAFFYTL